MNETTRSAIVAGLGILAVVLAAAVLDSTVTPEPSGSSGPDGLGGDGPGGLIPAPRTGISPGQGVQIPFLSEFLTVLAAVVTIAVIAYVVTQWRRTLGIVLTLGILFGMSYLLYLLLGAPPRPPTLPVLPPGNGSFLGGAGGGSGEVETVRPSPPSVVVLLVMSVALIGTLIALLRTAGGGEDDESAEESGDRTSEVAAVGRAAGRAADRIERESDVDNEVYRTWREMTTLLDVEDPRTSTPGEFAAAATEAGLGDEDVGELTRLFEDVRYGETQPSEEHERHAITVFRRIENRYAGGDP